MSLVLQLTREGYILSWTEDASILLGFSAQLSGACTLADAIHLDQNHAALLVERLAAGVSFTMSAVLVQQPTATEALCYDVEAWPIVDGSSTTGFFVKFSRCHEASDAVRKQRISESSFELITGNLSAMVYRALNDEHWSIQFASEAAFSILGVEADDLMSGKFSPAELVHPDDLEDVRLNIEEGLAARQPIHHQFRIITPDGETKWLDEKCRGVYDESGAVVAIEGLVFDIAKERELHVELARRNAALQVFVDRLPVAIAMFDTNMRYILHSKRWLFNFGLTESLVGQVHYDVFPNLPEKFISAHQKGLEGESHPRTVDCFIKSNGDEMWVRWELHPWFDDANNVGGIIIFSEDVSAEKQVSDEMVRVSHAVDAAEDAVFMLNPDTLDFFYVNDGAVRQTGYSREELLTMNPINLSPEYTLEQMFALVAPLTNNEVDRLSIEAIHLRKDHRAVPVEINLQRIEDINARLVIMGVARDRTEQKLAERLLQQSEERYRTIVSSMSDLIFVFNFEGYFIDVHYRSNDQLIFPKEAFMGRKISEVFDGPIADEFLAHLSELQRTGQTQSYDYTINQESVPTYYQATMNVDPEYTKVTVNVRNITVRKRMEIELKLREEILSAVSYVASALLTSAHWHEAMPESLRRLGEAAIADRVYLFTRGSDELGRDVVSQLFEWCSEGTSPEIDNPLMQNLRMPEIGYERWEEFFRQGESIRGRIADLPESERHYLEAQSITSLAVFPVTVNDQWWGFIGFDQCKDDRLWSHAELDAMRTASSTIGSAIQRQLAEQELHRLNEALEQRVAERTERLESANRELEAFSYSVSHDLRAPLRAIVGFSNILIEDFGEALGEDGCRVLRVIESNSLRMGGLIDDLISFARIGKQDLVGTAIDMANLVHQVADELRIAEAQHIAFKVDDLPRAKGDARLIRQVLLNLLSNALKYSALNPNPQITVSHFDDRKGMHVYAVRDNGVGFDMTYYDKLFGVFQRLHSNPEFEGTGIGLALVKRIIEKHGGSIWAEGKMGEGASFYFSLPGG